MKYELPKLGFEYNALEPHVSEEQLKIHHTKHHQSYVDAANKAFEKLENARKENSEFDAKSELKNLAFNASGHILHSLFWENLSPKGGEPEGKLKEILEKEFGSIERFKQEFSEAAKSTEGSGWAVLAYDKKSQKPVIMQIEKHSNNHIPEMPLLLVLDVWEHAYYLDYKNARPKFVEAFWNIVNWKIVAERLERAMK